MHLFTLVAKLPLTAKIIDHTRGLLAPRFSVAMKQITICSFLEQTWLIFQKLHKTAVANQTQPEPSHNKKLNLLETNRHASSRSIFLLAKIRRRKRLLAV